MKERKYNKIFFRIISAFSNSFSDCKRILTEVKRGCSDPRENHRIAEHSSIENIDAPGAFWLESDKTKSKEIEKPTHHIKSEKVILDELKAIYVVIPKTGCTTIKKIFSDFYGWEEVVNVHNVNSEIYEHVDYVNLLRSDFEKFYRFTFVRNPFSRIYSAYKSKVRPGVESSLFIDGVDRGIYNMGVRKDHTFEQFVNIVFETPDLRCDPHVKPQWRFIVSDDGILIVDELFKFEEFEAEMMRLLKNLDLDDKIFSVPHENKTQSDKLEYVDFYNQEMEEKILQKYKIDFELFD